MVSSDNQGQLPRDDSPITRSEMKEFIELTLDVQNQRIDDQDRRIDDLRGNAKEIKEDCKRRFDSEVNWIRWAIGILVVLLLAAVSAIITLFALLAGHLTGHPGT